MKVKDDFNIETGISTVTLQTKDGNFIGKAKIHPDDKPYINKFFGLRIAEIRAYIKSLNKKISIINNKIFAIHSLEKDFLKDENFRNLSLHMQLYILKKINEHILCYDNIIKDYKQEQDELKTEIKNNIKEREKIKKIIKDKTE